MIELSRDPRSSHTAWMLHLRAYQSHSSLMHQPDFSTCMLQIVRCQRPCLLPRAPWRTDGSWALVQIRALPANRSLTIAGIEPAASFGKIREAPLCRRSPTRQQGSKPLVVNVVSVRVEVERRCISIQMISRPHLGVRFKGVVITLIPHTRTAIHLLAVLNETA